jgi:hypothetical protein
MGGAVGGPMSSAVSGMSAGSGLGGLVGELMGDTPFGKAISALGSGEAMNPFAAVTPGVEVATPDASFNPTNPPLQEDNLPQLAALPQLPATGGQQPAEVPAVQPVAKSQPNAGGNVFSSFMNTVKTGVQNPYALAAIASTGSRESGFKAGNATRTWNDPSESGQPGRAGGIMSWRGPRYERLAATGDLSPAGQAKFFLSENPQLIQQLNNAKSVEEAQGLMNRAWAFAGYDRPGGETAARMAAARKFLPQFAGNTAYDPSIGNVDLGGAVQTADGSTPSGMDPTGFGFNPSSDQGQGETAQKDRWARVAKAIAQGGRGGGPQIQTAEGSSQGGGQSFDDSGEFLQSAAQRVEAAKGGISPRAASRKEELTKRTRGLA